MHHIRVGGRPVGSWRAKVPSLNTLLVCLSASTVSGKATPKEDATDVPPAQQFDDDILATFAPFESVCVTRTQTEYHVEYHHIDYMGHLIKD